MMNFTTTIEEANDGSGDGIIKFPAELWEELGITPYDGMPIVWEMSDDESYVTITFPDAIKKFRDDLAEISD